jgi:hypothetical protein
VLGDDLIPIPLRGGEDIAHDVLDDVCQPAHVRRAAALGKIDPD